MDIVLDDHRPSVVAISEPLPAGPEVEEFANALDDCLAPSLSDAEKRDRILDLPRKYYENALRRLARARPRKRREGTHDDVDMDVDEAEANNDAASTSQMKQLEKEAQTWDLVRRLLPLRYPGSTPAAAAPDDLFHEFLEKDPTAKERQAVIQWLQTNASSGPDIDELARELQRKAERGDIVAHGWIHTRTAIKMRKSVHAWPHLLDRLSPSIENRFTDKEGHVLITQLDPDAPSRQGRKLEAPDAFFERAVWLGCFEHLRRGSSPEVIREWCQERTEMWRYVSSSAMLLSGDAKATSVEDPASLALWRRMCFGLARQGGYDDYERAVYGVLSGDISSVEKVALTWDDFLFANYNAMLRTQLDSFLLDKCPPAVATNLAQSFPSFDAIQFHGETQTAEKRLMHSLESNPQIRKEAVEPTKALQASLISREIDRHLFEQGLVLATSGGIDVVSKSVYRTPVHSDLQITNEKYFGAEQHHGLRISAHVYLLLALLDKYSGGAKPSTEWKGGQENIIAGYTNYLRLAQLPELIPLYCSIISTTRCYEALSYNLITENSISRRLTQLKLVRKAGIDVMEFVRTQAWLMYQDVARSKSGGGSFPAKESFSIIAPGPPTSKCGRPVKADFLASDEDVIDIKHEYLIRSMEWLMLVNETWPNVFAIGTRVYKFFLKHLHLNAARQLMKRVSFTELVAAITGQDEVESYWFGDVGFWAQQLENSQITYAKAESVAADARNYRELEGLVQALDNMETVASMAQLANEAPERKFWTEVGVQVKTVKETMQPLLSGWLIAGIEEGDEELRELRQAYLPETIMAYVSTLHFAGTGLSRDHLLECMELAAVIAERSSDLSTAFVAAGRMKELVEAFAACSKALAISTGEKRTVGSGSKKLREMGWSRDLWSVKP